MWKLLFLPFVPFFIGCTHEPGSNGKLRVVATTTILADAVARVGGEHVQVDSLMAAGVDPHRYTASTGDVTKLAHANLILFHGLHLEGKMDDILKVNPPAKAVAVCEAIPEAKRRQEGGMPDPHVWMDPELWMIVVETIADELSAADPGNEADYRKNARQFVNEITILHAENRKAFAELAKNRRVLVTSHDAFAYFGAAYGLEVRGLQGISTASETGTRDVDELVEFLGSRKIPAVFAETSVPEKGLQTVLDAVKRKYQHSIKLVGGDDALYSDALGGPGSGADSYTGMLRHNVTVIANALK